VDTLYRLQAANVFGCTAEDSLRVRVSPRLRTYVPTAFSPNDDGRNDVLRLYAGPEVAKVVSFEVYGRWGNKVFASTAPAPAWDGSISMRPAPVGVYLWQAEVELLDGRRRQLKGEVSLVR
jgi:gliding motility-associated-like protein